MRNQLFKKIFFLLHLSFIFAASLQSPGEFLGYELGDRFTFHHKAISYFEHVEDVNFFIRKSSEFLKKNGLMFVATLNKTLKSYIFAILGAEYILRWLPIGTHDWEKFVEPSKLIEYGKKNSLELEKIDGIKFNPIIDEWKISKDQSVNYIAKFTKF